jgi:RNA polymerase sigma-70 factor, ECF subfamily
VPIFPPGFLVSIGAEFDSVLTAAQAGGEWAFAALYRDLNPRLLRYFGAQAASMAEDLAAETWLAVARGMVSFNGNEDEFRGWLFTIARRRLIQHWRSAGRRPSSPVDPETLLQRPAADNPEATGLSSLSAQEAAAVIVASLPPDQADVVLLRLVAGLDVDRVAKILGKQNGTVRVLQHRALRRLGEVFSQEALTG